MGQHQEYSPGLCPPPTPRNGRGSRPTDPSDKPPNCAHRIWQAGSRCLSWLLHGAASARHLPTPASTQAPPQPTSPPQNSTSRACSQAVAAHCKCVGLQLALLGVSPHPATKHQVPASPVLVARSALQPKKPRVHACRPIAAPAAPLNQYPLMPTTTLQDNAQQPLPEKTRPRTHNDDTCGRP
jgi:hypothetical protein